jgi:transposase
MFDDPISHQLFSELRMALASAEERVKRTDQSLRDHVVDWRWYPSVQGLMTMRGFDFVAATTLVAEIGDFRRFPTAPSLMAYVGLVPTEHSSGPKQHRGGITKTGNRYVRRILVEAAWNYRFPAKVGETMVPRQEGQPQNIIDIAWKAQIRLCGRYRKLKSRGKHQNKICTAIARELVAFCWDIARSTCPTG